MQADYLALGAASAIAISFFLREMASRTPSIQKFEADFERLVAFPVNEMIGGDKSYKITLHMLDMWRAAIEDGANKGGNHG